MNESFEHLKNDGITAGIEWKDAVFKNVDYAIKSLHNNKSTDIDINFHYKGLPFKIKLRNCYEVKNKWLMNSTPKFGDWNSGI